MKKCPECLQGIEDAAKVCHHCQQRIAGTQCPHCLAYNKEGAMVCQWCTAALQRETRPLLDFERFETTAQMLPTVLFANSFTPQRCIFTKEKLSIITPNLFGLVKDTEEVAWSKVSGFNHYSGLLWDRISIETRGQTQARISHLAKADAQKIVDILQRLEQ